MEAIYIEPSSVYSMKMPKYQENVIFYNNYTNLKHAIHEY